MFTIKARSVTSLLTLAFILALVTIFYNLAEGIISIIFGIQDETLALLGFGTDSFVEVISGIGIAHMVVRMHRGKVEEHDKFERLALRITAFSFFLLTAGLVTGAGINIIQGSHPSTTLPGVIIALISIATMYFLMHTKLQTGRALNSQAIIADARCTQSCFYLSIVLLLSSGLYELFRIPYIDVAGSLAIAWFAFREGREALEKVRENKIACGCGTECG